MRYYDFTFTSGAVILAALLLAAIDSANSEAIDEAKAIVPTHSVLPAIAITEQD